MCIYFVFLFVCFFVFVFVFVLVFVFVFGWVFVLFFVVVFFLFCFCFFVCFFFLNHRFINSMKHNRRTEKWRKAILKGLNDIVFSVSFLFSFFFFSFLFATLKYINLNSSRPESGRWDKLPFMEIVFHPSSKKE